MFKAGETIVHPVYGAGVVVEVRTMTYQGRERIYFCIELIEKRGTLMIPVDDIEQAGLRLPMMDTDLFQEVFEQTPQPLPEETYTRQTNIEQKLNSGNVILVMEMLRDLCWREHLLKLSFNERKLKERAFTRIIEELTLSPRYNVRTTKALLEGLIEDSMQVHLAQTH